MTMIRMSFGFILFSLHQNFTGQKSKGLECLTLKFLRDQLLLDDILLPIYLHGAWSIEFEDRASPPSLQVRFG